MQRRTAAARNARASAASPATCTRTGLNAAASAVVSAIGLAAWAAGGSAGVVAVAGLRVGKRLAAFPAGLSAGLGVIVGLGTGGMAERLGSVAGGGGVSVVAGGLGTVTGASACGGWFTPGALAVAVRVTDVALAGMVS
jgi:hypothetical protein